jgi:hypothetical protein
MEYGKSLIWQSYVMGGAVIILIYFQYSFERLAKSQSEKINCDLSPSDQAYKKTEPSYNYDGYPYP